MNRKSEFTVRGLIRKARGKLTQEAFANMLGVDQTRICKYEKGLAAPPSRIIETCMTIIKETERDGDISSGEIAKRIKKELSGPEFASIRKAFTIILDGVRQR